MNIWLRDDFSVRWAGKDVFAEVAALDGEVFRAKEGRRTLRVVIEGKGYFLKHHCGVGWGEIIKNLLQLRLPVLGAANEYAACTALNAAGVNTMVPVAFGVRGHNPATQESFLITEELAGMVSLEDVCKHWQTQRPSFRVRYAIGKRVADISRRMHGLGINHRDFYLCHFLVNADVVQRIESGHDFACHLIDLHRAVQRPVVPERWLIKDLGGLYYSALDAGLTRHDGWRFLCRYRQQGLRHILANELPFWDKVRHRARQIYQRDFGRLPQEPFPR